MQLPVWLLTGSPCLAQDGHALCTAVDLEVQRPDQRLDARRIKRPCMLLDFRRNGRGARAPEVHGATFESMGEAYQIPHVAGQCGCVKSWPLVMHVLGEDVKQLQGKPSVVSEEL